MFQDTLGIKYDVTKIFTFMTGHIAEAHMTTRGQIAVPKKVKELLGAQDGDYVLFFQEGKRIYIEAGKIVPKNK